METVLYVIVWVLVGTFVFFARTMLDSLAKKIGLISELNGLSNNCKIHKEEYYISLVLFHYIFLPIGVSLLIGDVIKFAVAHISRETNK